MRLAPSIATILLVSVVPAADAALQINGVGTHAESFDAWSGSSAGGGTFDLGTGNYTVSGSVFGGLYSRPTYTNTNAVYALRDSTTSTDRAFGAKVGTSGGAAVGSVTIGTQNATTQLITGYSFTYDVVQLSRGSRATTVKLFYRSSSGSGFTPVPGADTYFASTGTDGALPATITTSRSGAVTGIAAIPDAIVDFQFQIANGSGSGSNAHVGVSQFSFTPIFDNVAPTVTIAPATTEVVVSPSGPQSFGPIIVSALDTDVGGSIASFVAGTIPAQIADNIVITPGPANTFTVSGSGFVHADIGTYLIPFTATDNIGVSTTRSFTLSVIPEPTTLLLLTGVPALLRRRRR